MAFAAFFCCPGRTAALAEAAFREMVFAAFCCCPRCTAALAAALSQRSFVPRTRSEQASKQPNPFCIWSVECEEGSGDCPPRRLLSKDVFASVNYPQIVREAAFFFRSVGGMFAAFFCSFFFLPCVGVR